MKNLLLLIFASAMLVACGESNNTETTSSTSSSKCDSVLTHAVETALPNAKNINIKWSKEKYRSCGVSLKIDNVDYQIDLELTELGTANDEIEFAGQKMTKFEQLKKVISSYKSHEDIQNVGNEAHYYKVQKEKLTVLAGDNVFTLSTINWNTRGADKPITLKVAQSVINELSQ